MRYTKMLLSLIVAPLLACAALSARADHPAETLVRDNTQDVMQILQREGRPGNEKVMRDQVAAKVLPYFDFQRMTGLAVGRAWLQATPQQKTSLTQEFRALLVNTYSNALILAKGAKINVRPVNAADGAKEVTVNTDVQAPNAQKPIRIDYRLAQSGNNWQVFDVAVDGISIVTTHRSNFGQIINQGGVDALIKYLTDRNQQLAKGGQ